MRRSLHARSLVLPALLAVAAFGLLAGCDSALERRHQDNPFDPDGPQGGDGLQVRAIASPNQILLTWNQPQDKNIIEYFLYIGENASGPFEELAIVAHSATATGTYILDYPEPTRTHWFKAQAFTAGGSFSLTSLAVAAQVAVGPTVVVGDTVSSAFTRYPLISVDVTFGDSLLVTLADSQLIIPGDEPDTVRVPDFRNALRIPVTTPGLPTEFTLDLGPAEQGDKIPLAVKAKDALGESAHTALNLTVAFNPQHTLIGVSPTNLVAQVVDLAIPATGVVNMRFASSEAALAATPWLPGADTYPGYELTDSANTQEIWGEFVGDFGYNTVHKLEVRPNLLAGALFRLKIPTDRIVSQLTVVCEMSAQALEMRISENPNFAAVPWQAFADTVHFQLSEGEGTKTVYAQYRNDWTQSDILSDYCIYLSQGPDVKILVPAPGNVLPGGNTLLTRGTASAGSGTATIDAVRVDFGDGLGFREVIGTDVWQLSWPVPLFDADTELVLRARVWSSDSLIVTDVVTVTVSQLAIAILDPLDGADVTAGDPVNISGTANGILGGAPVDAVEVTVNGEPVTVNGTDLWSATWTAPLVAVDTPATIVATVRVGAETRSEVLMVTVKPLP